MATIKITSNPSIITAADTNVNDLVMPFGNDLQEISIRVITGTFKINTAGPASSGVDVDSSDGLFVITLDHTNGAADTLSFQAAAINDQFKIYL